MSVTVPPDVVEAYVFANTPSYLFRKLMESEYVLYLSKEPEYVLFGKILSSKKEDAASIADAYASIVALLKKSPALLGPDADPPLSRLQWSDALVGLYRQKVTPVTRASVKYPAISNVNANGFRISEPTLTTIVRVEGND